MQTTLFNQKIRTKAIDVVVSCAGCSATATVITRDRDPLPAGWSLCGADETGRLLAWCVQCGLEGRHERHHFPTCEVA